MVASLWMNKLQVRNSNIFKKVDSVKTMHESLGVLSDDQNKPFPDNLPFDLQYAEKIFHIMFIWVLS